MKKTINSLFSIIRNILLCLFLLVFSASSKAATIYFNDIFQGTGSSYTTSTSSINSIIYMTGVGFRFTSTNPGDVTFIANGNDVSGTLEYTNSSGVTISLTGVISRQDKVGNTTKGLYFVVSPTPNNAYLLVIPGYSYTAGVNVSTSSDPIESAMNEVLTAQQTGAPIIAVSSQSVYEDAGYASFTVTLNKNAASTVTYTPTLVAVTATTPADFTNTMESSTNNSTWTNVSSSVSMAVGANTLYIRVPIVSDNTPESTETFNLVTGATTGASVLNSNGAYGITTILERISVTNINYTTIGNFTSCAGTASDQQSFTVSGSGLTANIVITAPTGFEVSITSGSGYASSVTLTQSGGSVSSTTIYARLSSSATGSPTGNITATSSGATTQNVAVAGAVSSVPTTSNAGIDKTINNNQTVPMTANTPTTGTGAWTFVSGPSTNTAQLSSLSSATAVFDPDGGVGTYVMRWTITNSPCPASTDDVTVTVTSVLHVIGLNFSATKQNEKIILNWSTASEQNSKDFLVQHSSNSTNWNNLGTVLASGNSSSIKNYSYNHNTPVNGNNYYRLLQRDNDGKSSYSQIRAVKFENIQKSITLFANPITNGQLQFQVNAATVVSFYNNNGKLLWQQQVNAGTKTIDVSWYAKGTYFLKANNTSKKVVIQ